MGEFGENAIFGPKTSIFDYYRGGGKSVVLNYKVFDQVKQVPKNQRVLSNSGGSRGVLRILEGPRSSNSAIFVHFMGLRSIG